MAGSTTIARGNVQTEIILSVTLTAPTVPANTTVESTYPLPNAMLGDFVELNKPSHTTGMSVGNIRISAPNVMAIQFVNSTASAIVGISEAYLLVVSRFDGAPGMPPSAI